ncbi:MAG: hypothetical protein A3C80_02790 [Candidatus Ryanbacteria bacterium RIFCSPHIGHO2_02_FULL_45_43]|uniref:DUF3850 domain-containing protein n=1 Tax=Candidatus Ryanbacteria bacterium RIFCSPHIGHO2_01_45_13 TaxID=1802112 RepID=A0A1G2FZL0_9BACT|nr:MAG: hypothetical protein A2718_01205 [Candidatus Ryanbacteria bacterium RIFCSPHIGHO2_01_FULL_44_130]OGZ43524.1 MAG: hypothetical protein A2W41_04280 [Candidatus Ryanbacteria bacterium RIFCSPHIGHO2_01_45_13]OGZ47868.1 MAG: hypothetical protein A3C80_02790 [Candidatus Ryanbacteria bacterium RIFCSPHIGHO2_02_FULL_45_43]OGZ49913.1 MAG: hypothetical protein A3E55_03825 [Candidatus Ryanbacteria bacterium RIFCSPHIGHO2_12_FULL_44_20]OGZ51023.1 MAG: hypothetical protein A3A17_03365 [Candidatus Ryanba
MATIEKKIWPKYFRAVKEDKKKFEMRLADFKVKSGDTIILKEWNPKTKAYMGRELRKKVNAVFIFHLNDFHQKKEIEKKGFYIIQF